MPLEEWRHVDGYHQKDFAIRNAGWYVADLFAERLLTTATTLELIRKN